MPLGLGCAFVGLGCGMLGLWLRTWGLHLLTLLMRKSSTLALTQASIVQDIYISAQNHEVYPMFLAELETLNLNHMPYADGKACVFGYHSYFGQKNGARILLMNSFTTLTS